MIKTYNQINPDFGGPKSNYLILQVLRDFWNLNGCLRVCRASLKSSLEYGSSLINKLFDDEISFDNFLLEKNEVVMSKFYVIVSGWDDQILISQLQDYLYDYLLTLTNLEHISSRSDPSQEG